MSGPSAAALVVALVLGASIVYQRVGAARDRRTLGAPGFLAKIGNRRLHCVCSGTGTPAVVFESGVAASSLSWSVVQPEVAAFTSTCSYDRAGLAWSEAGEGRRSIAGFVGDLRRLLAGIGIPPPYVLVGHSFGGLIVRAYARAYPTEVAGLVFVDSLHPEEWVAPTIDQRRLLRGGVFLSRVGAVLAWLGVVRLCLSLLERGATGVPRRVSRLFGPTAARLLEHIVGEVQKLPRSCLPAVRAHWSNPRAFRAMAQHLASLPRCSREMVSGRDRLEDIPVVSLSAATRSDRWKTADAAVASLSAEGRHIVSSRAGHWVQLDDPSLVVGAVRQMVDRFRSRLSTPGAFGTNRGRGA